MARVKIKELDSLFILRHAQRSDKVALTQSSIDFPSTSNDTGYLDSYNPPLATFQSTGNKSNNGQIQATNLGQQILNYIDHNINEKLVILKFHTSPYIRCVETIRFIIDYLSKSFHDDEKTIRCVVSLDQVLSEWLSADLDIDLYPPHDNGATLLITAIQYLNSNLPYHRNMSVEIQVDLHNSYKHGNPGCFNESFIQQYSRLNNGLISIIKHETNNLTNETDSKEIVLIMTHGACVRSLVSKLLGRSLYVEIPLASLSIAKPLMEDSKHYYWQLLKTDIDTKLDHFNQIDLYSKADPFQDFQTTFNHKVDNQLNFHSLIPASKTENFNRIRSQSLLTPRVIHNDSDDDKEDDSDDEGISFSAGRRRRGTISASSDNQRRFRSSSLFGPTLKNPFFSDESLKSHADSFERTKKSLVNVKDELVSPVQSIKAQANNITPSSSSSYQNIHEDDGTFGGRKQDSNELVPDLGESFSSNNSSTNSLHEEVNIVPGSFSKLSKQPIEPSQDVSTTSPSRSTSSTTLKQGQQKPSSLFDKSLIEKTLQEIHTEQEFSDVHSKDLGNNWLNFKDTGSSTPFSTINSTPSKAENKFKIDLYGKKDRLNLYGNNILNDEDVDDVGSSGTAGWFLGSNKY